MSTWNDFTLAEEVSTGAWGTINSTQAQNHSLIIAYASHYDRLGSAPTIKLNGIKHRIVAELPSAPYKSYYPYDWYYWYVNRFAGVPGWQWLHGYYWYGWYPYYYGYWRWWWTGRFHVQSNLIIAVAEEAGTIEMEGLGETFISQKLKVFSTNLTTPAEKEVTQIAFQRHDEKPRYLGQYSGDISVLADDIVVFHGTDYTSAYWQNLLTLTGSVTSQVLLQEFASYATDAGGARTWVGRIKTPGSLGFSWTRAGAGVSSYRFTPNVAEKNVVFPTVTTDKIYFEIQAAEDAFGNIAYPREFLALLGSLKFDKNTGVFHAWKREDMFFSKDDLGREQFTGWKRVEIWSAPLSKEAAVQAIPGVLIMENIGELKARVIYHNERW